MDDTDNTPVERLVQDLVAMLPTMSNEHAQMGVTDKMLREFAQWMFENHFQRYNSLSPKDFGMTRPLDEL